MHPVLRLYEDILSNECALALPALPRMIFVVHGSLTIGGQSLADGEAWHGEGAMTLRAGKTGVAVSLVLWDQQREIELLQKRLGIRRKTRLGR